MEKSYSLIFCVTLALLLNSCTPSQVMTPARFEAIQVGSPVASVEKEYGAPYDIVELDDGTSEYKYIHRYDVGPHCTEHIHYVYRVHQGKIISKNKRCFQAPIDVQTP